MSVLMIAAHNEDGSINVMIAAHMAEADHFGIESGSRISDKFERSGLTAGKSGTAYAPFPDFRVCVLRDFPAA